MSSTNYENLSPAVAGQIQGIGPCDVVTGLAEAAMEPGLFVSQGTADEQVIPAAGAASTIRGMILRSLDREVAGPSPDLTYAAGEGVNVLQSGRATAIIKSTVAKGAQAFVVNTGADAGKLRANAGGEAVALPGVVFEESVTVSSGDGLATVKLNLPQ